MSEPWARFEQVAQPRKPGGDPPKCETCVTRPQHETHVEERHRARLDLWAAQLQLHGEGWDPRDERTLSRSMEWCAEMADSGPDADQLTDEVVEIIAGRKPMRRFRLAEERLLIELGLRSLLDRVGAQLLLPPAPAAEVEAGRQATAARATSGPSLAARIGAWRRRIADGTARRSVEDTPLSELDGNGIPIPITRYCEGEMTVR